MNFDPVEKIAAAILYEGYILYPYRSTAIKNRQRWNFGTLYPRIYAQAQRPQEPYHLVAECLIAGASNPGASVDVRLRFLQLLPQQPEPRAQSADGQHPLTDPSLAWDEAVERTSEHPDLDLQQLVAAPLRMTLDVDANLRVQLTISGQMLEDGVCRLHLEVENVSQLSGGTEAKREEALPSSFVSAHLLLAVTGAEFVSLLEPEEVFRASAAACKNVGVFPVLAGQQPDRSILFCSPIILYDYPQIAPESAGDFFDGTEMDEMLTLRVLTLTDAEKEEMRNGDPRARKILERTETLTPDAMLKTHGIVRGLRQVREDAPREYATIAEWNPFQETKAPPETVRVFGVELRVGDRVRIGSPRTVGQRKTDIIDLALAGKVAVIEAIEQDFEDQIQLALVLDDDPGREFGMMRQPGHRFFFSPQDVEPVLKGEPA